MPEADIVTALIQLANGSIGLIIAVWVIREGMRRMDTLQTQHETFTNNVMVQQQANYNNFQQNQSTLTRDVLSQQQSNNDQLMGLVSTLCAQPVQNSKNS
jgi:hypothetical protein